MNSEQLAELSKYSASVSLKATKRIESAEDVDKHLRFLKIGYGQYSNITELTLDSEEKIALDKAIAEKGVIVTVNADVYECVIENTRYGSDKRIVRTRVLTYHHDPILAAQALLDYVSSRTTGKNSIQLIAEKVVNTASLFYDNDKLLVLGFKEGVSEE